MFFFLDFISFIFALILAGAQIVNLRNKKLEDEPYDLGDVTLITLIRINLETCRRHLIC